MLLATKPLKEQLPDAIIWQDELERYDRMRQSICTLYMNEYITEVEKDKMMYKLEREIIADEKKRANDNG